MGATGSVAAFGVAGSTALVAGTAIVGGVAGYYIAPPLVKPVVNSVAALGAGVYGLYVHLPVSADIFF